MKVRFAPLGLLPWFALLVGLAGLPFSAPAQPQTAPGKERIGIYDSRAIAIAYAGSAFHRDKMSGLRDALRKARDAGNAAETARLENEGKALQRAMHDQGFGTAPVDDLLALIAADLPAIRSAAGVSALVSKWNARELEKHPGATQVDVTTRLIDAFHPDERQRKYAIDIQQKKPE